MTYQPTRQPDPNPIILLQRNRDDWLKAWSNATFLREHIGLIHEIYESMGAMAFRWLLETADELIPKIPRARSPEQIRQIATVALEFAVKRTLKGSECNVFLRDHQAISCLLWFMRVEGGGFVNVNYRRGLTLKEPHENYLWNAVDEICRRALSDDWIEFHQYRREAIYILDARNRLSSVIPWVRKPEITKHPWTLFDANILAVLEELALRDAQVLGGTTVEFALVHGSEPAGIYQLAKQAQSALYALQGSKA